jgi:hypothetical protein
MNNWPATKQSPIEGFNNPCLNCSPRLEFMPLTTPLAIGFGSVLVSKDDETVWSGDNSHVWLRRFENKALKDPNHDWRVEIIGPLYECAYQRHGDGEWALISRGEGFA